jgi:hypothetical protein
MIGADSESLGISGTEVSRLSSNASRVAGELVGLLGPGLVTLIAGNSSGSGRISRHSSVRSFLNLS